MSLKYLYVFPTWLKPSYIGVIHPQTLTEDEAGRRQCGVEACQDPCLSGTMIVLPAQLQSGNQDVMMDFLLRPVSTSIQWVGIYFCAHHEEEAEKTGILATLRKCEGIGMLHILTPGEANATEDKIKAFTSLMQSLATGVIEDPLREITIEDFDSEKILDVPPLVDDGSDPVASAAKLLRLLVYGREKLQAVPPQLMVPYDKEGYLQPIALVGTEEECWDRISAAGFVPDLRFILVGYEVDIRNRTTPEKVITVLTVSVNTYEDNFTLLVRIDTATHKRVGPVLLFPHGFGTRQGLLSRTNTFFTGGEANV